MPVHPALAAILGAWKLSHWERIYGRAPTADDLIVPTRNMTSVDAADGRHSMTTDLTTLGLRVKAGEHRSRGGHDLRAWFTASSLTPPSRTS